MNLLTTLKADIKEMLALQSEYSEITERLVWLSQTNGDKATIEGLKTKSADTYQSLRELKAKWF